VLVVFGVVNNIEFGGRCGVDGVLVESESIVTVFTGDSTISRTVAIRDEKLILSSSLAVILLNAEDSLEDARYSYRCL